METTAECQDSHGHGEGGGQGGKKPRRKYIKSKGNKLGFANHSTMGTLISSAAETLGPDGFLLPPSRLHIGIHRRSM